MRVLIAAAWVAALTACAAEPTAELASAKERIPVYACADTRIRRARDCRPMHAVVRSSVLVRGSGNGPVASGPR